jgi:hypothetical protein
MPDWLGLKDFKGAFALRNTNYTFLRSDCSFLDCFDTNPAGSKTNLVVNQLNVFTKVLENLDRTR